MPRLTPGQYEAADHSRSIETARQWFLYFVDQVEPEVLRRLADMPLVIFSQYQSFFEANYYDVLGWADPVCLDDDYLDRWVMPASQVRISIRMVLREFHLEEDWIIERAFLTVYAWATRAWPLDKGWWFTGGYVKPQPLPGPGDWDDFEETEASYRQRVNDYISEVKRQRRAEVGIAQGKEILGYDQFYWLAYRQVLAVISEAGRRGRPELALAWNEAEAGGHVIHSGELKAAAAKVADRASRRRVRDRARDLVNASSDTGRDFRARVEKFVAEVAPPQALPLSSNPFLSSCGWPATEREETYYGLAGDIVRVISPQTEAAPVALLIHFVVAFGNLIGGSPYMVADGARHRCNLFAAIIGQSSKSRKGTAWSQVRRLLSLVDEGYIGTRVKGGLSSGEGLICEPVSWGPSANFCLGVEMAIEMLREAFTARYRAAGCPWGDSEEGLTAWLHEEVRRAEAEGYVC